MRISLILFFFLIAVFSVSSKEKFNILLFTADDLHCGSLESYGGQIKDLTPNIDRFAKESFSFQKAHVNVAICAPIRAVIATGLLSHNSGAMGFMPTNVGIPDIVSVFKKSGYHTGILGKNPHSTPVPGMTWDYKFGRYDLGNGRSPKKYYERAKVFFEQCKSADKPFYFMVNSHDPHRPFCNPKKLLKNAEMPSKVYKPEDVEVPKFVPDLLGVRQELAMYQNSTRRLDDTFGKVMQALKESGYAEKTLVVFMTDNGIAIPFAKCNTWFHATRTPFLFRLPKVIKKGAIDKTHFVSAVDLMPTFLELTGVPAPVKQDGRSILPLLKGGKQQGRQLMFTQIDKKAGSAAVPMRCVQNGKFAYIYNAFYDGKTIYKNNNEGLTMKAMNKEAKSNPAVAQRVALFRLRVPEELYDIEKDPDSLNNLIDNPEYKAVIKQLQRDLEQWMVKTNDPILEAFRNKGDFKKVKAVIKKAFAKKKK